MSAADEFEETFKDYRYAPALVQDISNNQHVLGGRTFFERLLEVLGIKSGRRLYPPRDDTAFAELHARIVAAPITLHYKHCLLFYLLKDLSPSHHHTPEISTAFASAVHLDTRFWVFIDGIWELDHLQFETAVSRLTDPRLIPTFPDEILMALLKRGDFHGMGGANGGADPLPATYWECVRPPLADPKVLRRFAVYMAQRNVTETYYWIRTRADHEQLELLEILIEETFAPAPPPTADVYPKEERAEELVSLPFSRKEEEWIMHYLSQGKGRALPGAQDTVQVMRLARGMFAEFAKEGEKGILAGGVNWDGLRDGVRGGVGGRIKEGV